MQDAGELPFAKTGQSSSISNGGMASKHRRSFFSFFPLPGWSRTLCGMVGAGIWAFTRSWSNPRLLRGILPLDPRWVVDAGFKKRYDEITSGRPDGRGFAFFCRIEESPHSAEHGTGETPGRGNLPERATETNSRRKAVKVKRRCKRPPASAVMRAAR